MRYVFCVLQLWEVQTGRCENRAHGIAELTHIVVLCFLLHRLLELFAWMLGMGSRLFFIECGDRTPSTTAVSAIAYFYA